MKTVIEMAREVYGANTKWTDAQLERLNQLIELVRADEREACAKVCDELAWKDFDRLPSNVAFAAAIRARGNT